MGHHDNKLSVEEWFFILLFVAIISGTTLVLSNVYRAFVSNGDEPPTVITEAPSKIAKVIPPSINKSTDEEGTTEYLPASGVVAAQDSMAVVTKDDKVVTVINNAFWGLTKDSNGYYFVGIYDSEKVPNRGYKRHLLFACKQGSKEPLLFQGGHYLSTGRIKTITSDDGNSREQRVGVVHLKVDGKRMAKLNEKANFANTVSTLYQGKQIEVELEDGSLYQFNMLPKKGDKKPCT